MKHQQNGENLLIFHLQWQTSLVLEKTNKHKKLLSLKAKEDNILNETVKARELRKYSQMTLKI